MVSSREGKRTYPTKCLDGADALSREEERAARERREPFNPYCLGETERVSIKGEVPTSFAENKTLTGYW